MENTPELKVKSFRADDETFEKFKSLATEEFGNQGQCLAALINLYEIEKSKLVLGDRKLEVETFQSHLNRLAEMFLSSMHLNQDAEIRIRGEFEKLLISKDKTISDLQAKASELAVAKQSQEDAAKQARHDYFEMLDKSVELEKQVARQDKEYAATLADKDSLNKVLTSSSEERKEEIDALKASLAAAQSRLTAIKQTEEELAAALKENGQTVAELERLRAQSELDRERAVLNAEKMHQQELKETYAQHHEEMKEYIARIDRLQAQHDEQAQRISDLEHNRDAKPLKPQKG